MFSLQRSILSALAYHSIFNYPLTVGEIHRYLISDTPVSISALKQEIQNLLKTKKILQRNDFFLPLALSPHPSSLVTLRQRRKDINLKKLIIAKQASRIISMIPWVKMVAVTGALAMENTDKDDDIDLMVVASKNRLWIVRPVILILISLFFKRRKPTTMSKEQKTITTLFVLIYGLMNMLSKFPKVSAISTPPMNWRK